MSQQLRLKATYDRHQVRKVLGRLTVSELQQLRRNPTFPKPVYENDERGDDYIVEWAQEDIEQFKREMESVAAQGWVIPIALYRWPGW